MAIFKCKMCGGSLEVTAGETIIECEYCGTQQTLPKTTDENVQSLFNRANLLRQKSEFDKAEAVYEKILAADETESEAYWGVILCKFGIEYVEDPTTFKRVPTCHRTSYDSIIADEYYKKALEHADATQRAIYEREAKQIDEIQKGILAISAQEEPYDVFICYKETDSDGKRTQDSVIANDIYHQLTTEGFKVFYAAITLEDKLGSAYEPIIFAALNSSKVMLSIGTKPEHFNAVWVKNEWSRFLKMMKNDRSKMLIPCYKGMDAYELPEEFAHLQAQDMGKIGFINDIVRGIKKVVVKDEPQATVVKETVVTAGNANTAPLLKRAFMFLEDGDWNGANEYCEKVLDIDPENAQAYLGKLMAELRVKHQDDLKNCAQPFNERNNFQKALRFADDTLKKELQGYIDFIMNRNFTNAYNDAVRAMEAAISEIEYKRVAEQFEKIRDFKDAKELAAKCLEDAEEARLNAIYMSAKKAMEDAKSEDAYKRAASKFYMIRTYQDSAALEKECYAKAEDARKDKILAEGQAMMKGEIAAEYEAVIRKFQHIPGWRNVDELIDDCKKKIEEINAKEEAERLEQERQAKKRAKRMKLTAIIAAVVVVVGVAAALLCTKVIVPNVKYNKAVALMDAGKYDEAAFVFGTIRNHKDAQKLWMALSSDTIAVGDNHTVGLKSDGTVVATGDNDDRQCNVSSWTDIVAIAAGPGHTVGLKSGGTVVAVGRNGSNQCNVHGWKDIVAVSASRVASATVGLKSDGTVVATGANAADQCDVGDWKNIVAIAAGGEHTVGLKSNGTVVATGYNRYDQCNVHGWKNIVAIAAGNYFTVGLKANGTVVVTNGAYRVSGWTDIVAIAAGAWHAVGLKSDGTVVATGTNDKGQCNVSGWTDIVAIAAGNYFTVGLKSDGTIVVAGDAPDGVSSWTNIKTP